MIKKLRVTVDGRPYDVTVEMDEASAPATSLAPAPGPAPAYVAPAPLVVPPPPPAQPVAAGDVPSPLAGRVTAVNVTAGQDVKEGDHLITLEAMKMNTFVTAPRGGKVKEVKVAVGTAVEEGQGLVTLG